MPELDAGLLDINQAAKLLNVSAVSLRRWTGSGRLSCLRVGGKRERRFRREDLLAFAEEQGRSAARMARNGSPGTVARALLEGIPVDYGSHLCAVYGSDRGRAKMAVPFLIDGLAAGDTCYLVAPPAVRRELLGQLAQLRPGLHRFVEGGQLVVSPTMSSGEELFAYFEGLFPTVTRLGRHGIRVVGDMAWFLGQKLSLDELADFEMRYDRFLGHSYPVISLCLYDARRFCGVGVLRALQTHEDTLRYPLSRFLVH